MSACVFPPLRASYMISREGGLKRAMLVYAARRVLQAIPVLVLASIAIFLLLRLIPGDLAVVLAGTKGSPEVIAALRKDLGLDQPLPVQYVVWRSHIARGDL